MRKFPKIIIVTFTLYMLLCIPAFAAQQVGGYVSNTPIAAGKDASIGEVWMRHGGARLQYDALMGSIQMNTNGRMRRDPAAVTILPPLYPKKYVVRKKSKSSAAKPKPTAAKGTAPSTAGKPKATSKVNPSPKPTLQNNDSKDAKAPYSGMAPVAPTAPATPATTGVTGNITPANSATTTATTGASTTTTQK